MQQKAFMEYLKAVQGDNGVSKPTKKKILKEAGYSDSVANKPSKVFDTPGWEDLLEHIDNTPYLARLHKIAMGDDKRAALKAIDRILEIQGLKKGDGININISKSREEIFGA